MEKAGFLDRIGRQNVSPHVEAALARSREILGLPPVALTDPFIEEKQKLEAARQELTSALERASQVLNSPPNNAGGSNSRLQPPGKVDTLPGKS